MPKAKTSGANISDSSLDRYALDIQLPPNSLSFELDDFGYPPSLLEVERRLSVVEELESVVSANLQRASRLRQSILQKAFTGGLLGHRHVSEHA